MVSRSFVGSSGPKLEWSTRTNCLYYRNKLDAWNCLQTMLIKWGLHVHCWPLSHRVRWPDCFSNRVLWNTCRNHCDVTTKLVPINFTQMLHKYMPKISLLFPGNSIFECSKILLKNFYITGIILLRNDWGVIIQWLGEPLCNTAG